jgi:hypothetical protein
MSQNSKVSWFIGIVVSLITIAGFIFLYIDRNNQILDLNNQVRELHMKLDDEKRLNEKLFALLVAKTSDGTISPTDLGQFLSQSQVETIVQQAGIDIKTKLPFYLETQFIPSGWMGDGEQRTTFISLSSVKVDFNGTEKVVTKFEYRPGPKGWGGIYWQYPDGNWGDQPGKSLIGAKEIAFWARGENGGEIVEFKAGGVSGKRYEDTFDVSLGKVELSKDWQEFAINLSNQDLSNVIGAFASIIAAGDNGSQNVTIYIADLQVK